MRKTMKKIVILALHNAGASTITGPMDSFHLAGVLWNYLNGEKSKPLFEVKIVSVDGGPVNCLNRLLINPHLAIEDVTDADLILISSILDIEKTLEYEGAAIPWLNAHYQKGTALASVCTGAFVLAETGLLNGKTATTHWGYVEQFKQRYPKVNLKPERLITDEGDLYCSGASNACLDLSMYLIEQYCGHEVAVQCAKGFLLDLGRFSQAPYRSILNFQKKHADEAILQSQNWIESNFEAGFNIDEIAEKNAISRRTFERRFKSATGDTPLLYLQRVRIEAAKKLLEANAKTFDEIAYEVGYSESNFFRKIFKKHTNLTPKEYRNKFLPIESNKDV
jgi:transcriptional regulator GlxA family with amidase domain